jgi:ribose transport system ATP-binding protein
MISFSSQDIVKHYAGVVALARGNLETRSGEVVALIGANGSGKSTLCKIITGVVAPDGGQLLLDNQPVSFAAPHEALGAGISAVYQELSLVPTMSVEENIFLNHEPLSYNFLVNRRAIRQETRRLIELFAGTVRSSLTADTLVSSLPPDEQQIVEIIKAISHDPKILILDEATSSLDNRQVTRLFELVNRWKSEDKAIIFISHRMGEIFRIADRVTVLRNGRTVNDSTINEVTEKQLVNLMVERDAIEFHPVSSLENRIAEPDEKFIVLSVQDLQTDILKKVSFQLHRGELLGIGGLQGQGQTDMLKALFGAIPYGGNINYLDKPLASKHPSRAMQTGVAFVPGDRAREGLLFRTTIFENLLLPSWHRYGAFLKINQARKDAVKSAESLHVVMDGIDMPVSSLSGGNAQKIVIGKWLQRDPSLLLLNDPTKGVDVGAKAEFYELLGDLQKTGTSIIFYSSDDEELVGLCDRVLVMYDGHIRKELAGTELNLVNLIASSLDTSEEDWA